MTDDMELAAELVQDMSQYLTITELESIANFPAEMAEFRNVLLKVDEFNATRLKLTERATGCKPDFRTGTVLGSAVR